MSSQTQSAVADLRQSIDRLPASTRAAMLQGVTAHNTVITGGYASHDGGICPMVAAHRSGGQANALPFAEAWDIFTGVYGRQVCRPATQQEIGVLVTELRDSLGLENHDPFDAVRDQLVARWEQARALANGEIVSAIVSQTRVAPRALKDREQKISGSPLDLAAAIADHQSLVARRRRRELTGTPLDLAAAIAEHQSSARSRRGREAAATSMDWLLPDDITRAPEPIVADAELDFGVDAEFDFELT